MYFNVYTWKGWSTNLSQQKWNGSTFSLFVCFLFLIQLQTKRHGYQGRITNVFGTRLRLVYSPNPRWCSVHFYLTLSQKCHIVAGGNPGGFTTVVVNGANSFSAAGRSPARQTMEVSAAKISGRRDGSYTRVVSWHFSITTASQASRIATLNGIKVRLLWCYLLSSKTPVMLGLNRTLNNSRRKCVPGIIVPGFGSTGERERRKGRKQKKKINVGYFVSVCCFVLRERDEEIKGK